ncbi:MAG: hypothetical protein AB8G18_09715 [Gammaproteobacteria bacterium]
MTSSTSTWLCLTALWTAGFLLATGSKSYDPEESEPVDPVFVDFSVSTSGDLAIENGRTTDTISALTVSGSFEKDGNAEITLRNVPVTLDTTTSFNVLVVPNEGDNLLNGEFSVDVTADLEFGLGRLPTSGQLSVERNDTTSLITFDGDANNIVIAVGDTTRPALSFDDFRELFSDNDRNLDERFASKAYRTLESTWLLARFSETAQRDITDNLDMLESMGFGSELTLTCANSTGTPTPDYGVTWTVDPAGTGLGEAGAGDTFEFSWTNCQFTDDDRFLESRLRIADYQLNNETVPRNLSYSVVLRDTLVGEEAIDSSSATLTRKLVDGTLTVTATEGATVITAAN